MIDDGPLNEAERKELDGYGKISGRMRLPPRCIDLWSRELMWGLGNVPEGSSLRDLFQPK